MKEEQKDLSDQTLQQLITSAGTTQAKIAQNLGVSTNTVNAWLMRRKVPRADNFLALCRELNLSPKRLAMLLRLDIAGIPDDELDEEVN